MQEQNEKYTKEIETIKKKQKTNPRAKDSSEQTEE